MKWSIKCIRLACISVGGLVQIRVVSADYRLYRYGTAAYRLGGYARGAPDKCTSLYLN